MSKKLWGGRFAKKTDPLVEEFTKSIHYDYILVECDVTGSIYHVAILKKAKILKAVEAVKLTKALNEILKSVKNGSFKIDMKSEDIHTNVQNILQGKVGDLALKLHTARSRNDQVIFATKLCAKAKASEIKADIAKFTLAIESLAKKNKDIIIPGLTHMQHAQPVYLKDHLMAYAHMLYKDGMRLECIEQTMEMTMGSGALAGTPINAEHYNIKGCVQPTMNSIYSVSDRDFVIDILSALAITGMHLSRLSEDLIIWSTKEFDFIEIDESFCTGSSLMPQKKNPDVLELIRGYAGRLYGNLISVLTMMKGLPLAYNRDMQLDKEPLFNSFEIVSSELRVMAGLVKTLKFNKVKIEDHLEDEALYATDLVYYLVKKGIAFKNAHNIIGDLVKYSIDNGIEIKSMTDHELARFSDKLRNNDIIRLFDPKVSVESKKSVKR
jgi:argininosuccinate lyase